jgi:hypothetical protein
VLFELVKLAPQSATGLLAHRTAARLMPAGVPEVRRCDEWIAWFADADGDLHEVLLDGLTTKFDDKNKTARGGSATRAV